MRGIDILNSEKDRRSYRTHNRYDVKVWRETLENISKMYILGKRFILAMNFKEVEYLEMEQKVKIICEKVAKKILLLK